MNLSQTNYVVVSPVRNEEAYIRFTLDCMVRQTILPKEWVIVNDGSTDRTGSIIDEYARQYSWIRVVHRVNRGFRKAGGGVVDAFNEGYQTIQSSDWDFVVKLDGDLSFQPDYFEKCFANFASDPRLGVGGGVICNVVNGIEELEKCPAFHVRGATKIYRRGCWDAIGGFWPAPGWGQMDGSSTSEHGWGWTTKSFPDLHILHHRYTGTAEGFMGWASQKRPGELHLWLSSAIYGVQVRAPACPKALFDWFSGALLWIHNWIHERKNAPQATIPKRSVICGASSSAGCGAGKPFGGEHGFLVENNR